MPQFEDEDMYEIFDGFLVETGEILEQISTDLIELENNPDNLDLVNQLFRSFHTIKGTSSFMGFVQISEFTHEAEDLLNKLRKSELTVSERIIEILLLSRDAIETMVYQIKDDEEVSSFPDILSMIEEVRNGNTQRSPSDSEADTKKEKSSNIIDTISDTEGFGEGGGDFSDDEEAMLQAAFAEINSGFLSDDKEESTDSASEDKVDRVASEAAKQENNNVISSPNAVTAATEVSAHSTPSITPSVSSKKAEKPVDNKNRKPSTNTETIRIDIERVEALMDLSGELVLSRNRLAQITHRLETNPYDHSLIHELIDNYTQLDKVTSDIQNSVMKMRMVQVGKLYQKAPRIVRDLSKEFDKNIKLVVSGEDTEIDRTIIEELNDPLVHMIRNSCDHGIESKEERRQKGKPEEGHIYLDAYQEGNNIILKIGDDGAGINPEFIKSKSLEKGIITPMEAEQMSEKEIIQLIFAPGFSTAKVVSSVSGRGVGMDVVKTNIQKLKGSIEIDSEIDKGSTFIIKLPLTLAIIQGLLVKIQEDVYALPLTSVDEVVTVESGQIETINSRPVIKIRNEIIPIFDLEKMLHGYSNHSEKRQYHIVIVAHGTEKSGIIVDDLQGQQEIVIKSLGPILQGTKGITGSTILGDGRVIMILDIGEMLEDYEETEFIKAIA